MALVGERPGITVGEAAERLKVSRQTLYNVSARRQREGRLRKQGRGFLSTRLSSRRRRRREGAASLLSERPNNRFYVALPRSGAPITSGLLVHGLALPARALRGCFYRCQVPLVARIELDRVEARRGRAI
jgi:hypothetical protein